MTPRLHVDDDLTAGQAVALSDSQAHYLRNVMRLGGDAEVLLFNGRDGEWSGRLEPRGKKSAIVVPEVRRRPQTVAPPVTLLFAPVKRGPIDFLVQKATELGVARLQPVLTIRTVVDRVNLDRFAATAIEAAEQCGRLTVPALGEPVTLERLLDHWPTDQSLVFCDERGGPPMLDALRQATPAPQSILIGPEGGFDPREQARLHGLACCLPVSLGPRILRAETAALAALTLWQAVLGDWPSDEPGAYRPAAATLA